MRLNLLRRYDAHQRFAGIIVMPEPVGGDDCVRLSGLELIDVLDESEGGIAQFHEGIDVIAGGKVRHSPLIEALIELIARRGESRDGNEQQPQHRKFAQGRFSG
jgi:hypothetical protein